MGVGSFGSSCLPTRFFCSIRQSDPRKKDWSKKKEEAKGQTGEFGKNFGQTTFFLPKSLGEAERGNFGKTKAAPLRFSCPSFSF